LKSQQEPLRRQNEPDQTKINFNGSLDGQEKNLKASVTESHDSLMETNPQPTRSVPLEQPEEPSSQQQHLEAINVSKPSISPPLTRSLFENSGMSAHVAVSQ